MREFIYLLLFVQVITVSVKFSRHLREVCDGAVILI